MKMLHHLRCVALLLASLFAGSAAQEQYIVFSQPKMRWIGYVHLPDPTPRTLVNAGLVWPTGIAIDYPRMKLYVTDKPSLKLFWYQIIVLPGGKLVTDGQQHVAVSPVQATMMTTDSVGDLYWTGAKMMPAPYAPEGPGVFKHPTIALLSGNTLADGTMMYDRKGNVPSDIITDGKNVWWGNAAGQLNKDGSPIADNLADVTALVMTPKYISMQASGKRKRGATPRKFGVFRRRRQAERVETPAS